MGAYSFKRRAGFRSRLPVARSPFQFPFLVRVVRSCSRSERRLNRTRPEASVADTKPQQGTAPARGEQDHDAMRAASMQPVTGPASTDVLAASGGLNVPGSEPESTSRIRVAT